MELHDRMPGSYDVFVSYSSKDCAIADKIVADLERHGIRCWYAHRDMGDGKEWASAISSAIRGAKVFVVVYTGEKRKTVRMVMEVKIAAGEDKMIVPFVLAPVPTKGELAYYLSRVHLVDAANKPLEEGVCDLRDALIPILRELDGSTSGNHNEPESQSHGVFFSSCASRPSVSMPELASSQPQGTSRGLSHTLERHRQSVMFNDRAETGTEQPPVTGRRRIGLFGGIRDLVSDAFDRLGERNQPDDTKPGPRRGRSRTVAAPPISSVQFAAISPRTAPRLSYSTVDIVMYEDGWEDAVANVAKEHGEATKTTASGWVGAREGAEVLVRLTSPDLGDIGERTGAWHGRYLRFGFSFKIPEDFREREVLLDAEVLFDGIPATHLSFVAKVGKNRESAMTIERRDITSAFMSYSSKDRGRVAVLMQGIEAARPDLDVFLDVEKLRSGDEWERVLSDEIESRDVLFLCWSRAASESRWVNFEWHCAYESKGLEGIEPVAIESPDVCPPPKELESKHFNSRLLYIANSASNLD